MGEIVQALDAYGRLPHGPAALGLFLNAVKETIGGGDPLATTIDRILLSYQLMTPVKTTDLVAQWTDLHGIDVVQEKIIGENTLRHVAFLEGGLRAARSVAYIHAGEWTGTGFLLAPSLIVTNNHVLPERTVAEAALFRFNYQLTVDGGDAAVRDYSAKPNGVFVTDERLDFAVVELAEPAGEDWGTLRVADRPPAEGQRVNIIQHPAGMHKQISIQNNFVQHSDDLVIQYLTATLGGSSGSPVLDDDWHVVGVHHAGGLLTEPGTGRSVFRNEGILMTAILGALPEPLRARILARRGRD
jgi:V8-like Glu-specific endopeptidase